MSEKVKGRNDSILGVIRINLKSYGLILMKFSGYVLPWRRSALSECSCLFIFVYVLVLHQAQSDIERGWVLTTEQQRAQLEALQQRNSKKEVKEVIPLFHFFK